ncbi:MAG: hypothetical protein ABI619_11480 [Betaproteobacteria bacterium]
MKNTFKPAAKRAVLTLSLIAGLSACGGGGDGGNNQARNPADDGNIPASAAANTAAFVRYLDKLPQNDSGEPLNAAGITPPTTDSDEPTDV